MKIVTVVGARPQFIKAAIVSEEIRKKHEEILIHTGQHYDYNMSKRFFEELNIPNPKYNLGISGGTHAQMTGKMMVAIEGALSVERPDCLLVYGDTNSTLAAALSAAKLHIPICHVEAGARTRSMSNPEEINRVCTDHVSSLLLCSCHSHLSELSREGLKGVFVGNPMYDAFIKYRKRLDILDINLAMFDGNKTKVPAKYYYLTCHREENTSDDQNLIEILNACNKLDALVVYPVHPRNRDRVKRLQKMYKYENILFVEPVGYLESICILDHAEKVITDSGGLQTEAFFARKKCVTILNFVGWPETMVGRRNELCRPEEREILEKLRHEQIIDEDYSPFGDGYSAIRIVESIEDYFRCLK